MLFLNYLRLTFAAVLVASCASNPDAKSADAKGPHPLVGKSAPDAEGQAVPGSGDATIHHKGSVVVVDFWATYCGPCLKEFPRLQALRDKYKGKVEVIGISEDEEADAVPPFVVRTGVKFPVMWDKGKEIGAKFSVDAMPSTFVLDGEGVVRFVHRGYRAEEADALDREVKDLIEN